MPREFTVLAPVAGYSVGSPVSEAQLEGCNVDALVQGGFLQEHTTAPSSDTPTADQPVADTPAASGD